jgi:alpha-tubulin suppressor-like RCC1 family protein
MFHSKRTTRNWRATLTTVLCGALLTGVAMAAPPTLQTISVTPTAKTVSVGQKQSFKATGTFSNGSTHVLGPDIRNIGAGFDATCALLTSGGVECWGRNDIGQLGDGSTTDSLVPRPVKGISTATAVDYMAFHGCAVLVGGTLRCWGDNSYGELGDGTTTSSATPVTVSGISTATAVSLSDGFSCALLASGSVQCWGVNGDGELGNGSMARSDIPVPVLGISTATALSVGYTHSCALLASGSVQCWGTNTYGELGNGSPASFSTTPVTVRGISTATAVAAGGSSACALLASGAVQCWGQNTFGQLGNGSYVRYSNVPRSVTGISTAIAITAGGSHHCAVLSSGSVKCWGDNEYGQLGTGTTKNARTPVHVLVGAPTRLVAGFWHTCALFSGGAMRCWGRDEQGQLGNRRKTDDPNPLPVNVIGTPGVVWQSSDPSRATITDRGVAIGRAAGNTTITAITAKFINDNAVLTVK